MFLNLLFFLYTTIIATGLGLRHYGILGLIGWGLFGVSLSVLFIRCFNYYMEPRYLSLYPICKNPECCSNRKYRYIRRSSGLDFIKCSCGLKYVAIFERKILRFMALQDNGAIHPYMRKDHDGLFYSDKGIVMTKWGEDRENLSSGISEFLNQLGTMFLDDLRKQEVAKSQRARLGLFYWLYVISYTTFIFSGLLGSVVIQLLGRGFTVDEIVVMAWPLSIAFMFSFIYLFTYLLFTEVKNRLRYILIPICILILILFIVFFVTLLLNM